MFEGLDDEAVADILSGLERRVFQPQSLVIAEGDTTHELYVIDAGSAEVIVRDRQGADHAVGTVTAGTTVGEMALFTGRPATSSVRAIGELEVLVLPDAAFEKAALRYPQIYRNLAAILSERLARTNRLTFREDPGKVVLVENLGGPVMLAWALASSIAWHSRSSTVAVFAGDGVGAPIEALARAEARAVPGVAAALHVEGDGAAPAALAALTADLCARFDHVIVHVAGGAAPGVEHERRVVIADAAATAPAGAGIPTLRGWVDGPDARPRDGVQDVPGLAAGDEALLAGGTLDLATPAGRAVGRLARELTGLRVGVALGAGSVMGFSHFGVFRSFEKLGVPLDAIAGTSVGAAAGCLTALGHDADAASDIFVECGKTLFRPTVSRKGIMSNRALRNFLRSVTPDDRIEELAIPFAAVAADLNTQREVVFKRGLLWQAVLASISIPGIYPPLRIGPYTVVDGGVLNPVPTTVVEDLGADVVVAVKLTTTTVDADLDAEAVQALRGGEPSAVTTIMRSIEIMQNRVAPPPSDKTTLMLVPKLTDVPTARLRAFKDGKSFEAPGEVAVEEALPRLRAALPWLRA